MISIQRKIIYGYAAGLGFAFGGTMAGLAIGNHYQQKAQQSRQVASQESQLLSRLQLDVLYNRPAKQLSPHLQDPDSFRQESGALLTRLDRIHGFLDNHNSSGRPATMPGLQAFLEEYEGVVAAFQALTLSFAQTTHPLTASSESTAEAQQNVVDLVKSSEFAAFIEAPDYMAELYEMAIQRESDAEAALAQAEQLRTSIILTSLGLSVALGVLLSLYTSREIARPIDAVSEVAQQVTRDGNFDLRAVASSQDAVGMLAKSLNQLIERVQQLMAEQQDYMQELEDSREAANAASQAKSDFLANMSHELRTPLNGILGYAQILENARTLPTKHRRSVEMIHNCGNHLLTLINSVLDLAKIEASKLELILAPVQLHSLLQDVTEMCGLQAEAKGVAFYYFNESELPETVLADDTRLRQVLINLLSNAVKFTAQGQVSLRVEQLPSDQPDVCRLGFQVEDTGVGIAAEDLERLFRAFEQVGARQRQSEGTGLGLAISSRIVRLMGGELQVSSELGVGSQFSFEVDFHQTQKVAVAQAAVPVRKILGYEGERRCILVVDDRQENRSLLSNLLEPLDFKVVHAIDGETGLNSLKTQFPDLMITDLEMPGMNGFEMLRQLRDAPNLAGQHVIVSSASVSIEDQQIALESGGDLFLPKPVDLQLLFAQIAQLLELTWRYEADEEVMQDNKFEVAGELVLPDVEELQSLLLLSQQGRVSRCRDQLTALVQADSTLRPFTHPLLALLETFQVEQFESTLQQYLSEAETTSVLS